MKKILFLGFLFLAISQACFGKKEVFTFAGKCDSGQTMNAPAYNQMVTASFGWPPIVWVICKELISDKAVDIILNFLPGFNKKDEIRDAIKAISNGDWLSFTWEAAKITVGQIPWVKALDTAVELRNLYKVVDKINDWVSQVGTVALERAWGILIKSPVKFSTDALKYVDDLAVPKLGGYFATVNTYSSNFKSKFSDVADKIKDVHHAIPQKIKNTYGLINDTQLHSLENLRGIPLDNPQIHIEITSRWNKFYLEHKESGFNLNEALGLAKQIDDDLGHLFVPPIR